MSRARALGAPTPDAAAAMLRGGLVPAIGAALVLAVVAAVADGRDSLASATLGAMAAVAVLSAGPLLMRQTRDWPPVAVMAAVVGVYTLTVIALGAAYLWLPSAGWLHEGWLGLGLIVGGGVWTVGVTIAVWRLRLPAYDIEDGHGA